MSINNLSFSLLLHGLSPPVHYCACVLLLVVFESAARAETAAVVESPVAPEESLEHLVVTPGLKIELVAHEPQVIDPVAIRFDEYGRMWVVEMRDYPWGPRNDDEQPMSRISILEDHDNDGRFETSTVFADMLLFATGIQPWKGGVFVTMAGQVAYMKDSDGDLRVDVVETWYTGFAEGNSQLRANHPRLALDNHIYIANGLRGGTIVDAQDPDGEPASISGMDFRFDPLTRKFEAVSGAGQFGLTFDDFGNRFVCSNRNPCKHIVLENHDLIKNPLVTVPTVSHDVANAEASSRIHPITRAWTTSNLHAGQFTAACGVEIYRGNALPKEFDGNVFTCDPTAHLVHREIMQPHGVTFTSHPAREGVEFLASRDEWFSPVNITIGPGGAIYVVDMYRAVIEHPRWVPDELKERPDLLYGNDRGRIYRIVPEAFSSRQARLSSLSSRDLVAHLDSPDAWTRETTARMLLERQDESVRPFLVKLVIDSPRPATRVHALWSLDGLGVLSPERCRAALADADARVQEQAIVLAEARARGRSEIHDRIEELRGSDDSRVRFRANLTLAPTATAPATLAFEGDPWELAAIKVSIGNRAGTFLASLLENHKPEELLSLFPELCTMAGASEDLKQRRIAINAILLTEPNFQRIGVRAFFQTYSHGELDSIGDMMNAEQRRSLDGLLADAKELAADRMQSDTQRQASIGLLAATGAAAETLLEISLEDPAQSVRLTAIVALSRFTDTEPWASLLDRFPHESPEIRRVILDGVLAQADRTSLLLDRVATGRIQMKELDRTRTDQLLKHGNANIQERAEALFGDSVPADRKQVLIDYQVVLQMEADAERGQSIFKKHCATCHKIGDVGVNVAPDISDSRTKTPQQYLTDIVQPNRAIDTNYLSYTVVTARGLSLSGLLSSETSNSVTLKQAEGKTVTLRRSEIDELRSNGVSLMPEGLEKQIPYQAMADLISFIKNWRYLDGRTPLRQE